MSSGGMEYNREWADINMGVSERALPDAGLLHHYHLQFAIIKGLIEGNSREALINADRM